MKPATRENTSGPESAASPPDDLDVELDVADLRNADPGLRRELSGVIECDVHQTERRFRRRPSVILAVAGEHRPAPRRPTPPPALARPVRRRRRPGA